LCSWSRASESPAKVFWRSFSVFVPLSSIFVLFDFNPVCEVEALPRLQAMIQIALGDVAGEADGVGDAAPGFEADEGAAGFVGGPEAIRLCLVAADRHVGALILVQ